MTYTTTNLTAVQEAIVALATGTCVVEVTIRNKKIRYGEADLDKLRALESRIQADLHRPRYFPRNL